MSTGGFREHAVHRAADDSKIVAHAEMVWPAGGGIMFGTYRDGSPDWPSEPGTAAVAAGGTSLYAPRDEDYGGRTAAVRP